MHNMVICQYRKCPSNVGRGRRPGGPARRVLRRRRDGSGRQLNAELGVCIHMTHFEAGAGGGTKH